MKRSKRELREALPFLGSNIWRAFKLFVIGGALVAGLNTAFLGADHFLENKGGVAQSKEDAVEHAEKVSMETSEEPGIDAKEELPHVAVIENRQLDTAETVPSAVKNYAVAQGAFKKNQATLANLLEE